MPLLCSLSLPAGSIANGSGLLLVCLSLCAACLLILTIECMLLSAIATGERPSWGNVQQSQARLDPGCLSTGWGGTLLHPML